MSGAGPDPSIPAPLVIAVDGPAAAGKGTLARALAARLGFAHLDTGGLYRAVGLALIRAGRDPADEDAAIAAAQSLDPALLDDPALRTDATARAASVVSALPGLRTALIDRQRSFAASPPGGAAGAVLDGRDIGTVICPEAPVKLFVTADVTVRAERRTRELQQAGRPAILPAVLADLRDRDARDSRRSAAPLRAASGAFVLDSTALSIDAMVDLAMQIVAAVRRQH